MIKKFLGRVYSILITIFIIIGLLTAGLYVAGIRPYIVQTGSMTPAISAGSICFVNHHAKYEDIQVGDVIAFRLGTSTMVTHRAVRFDPEGIVTKGDANRVTDALLVTEENFAGKTIFSIPEVGAWIGTLRTKNGKIRFLIFAGLLILCGFLLDDGIHKDKKSST